jgi:FlgD Ig-like domain
MFFTEEAVNGTSHMYSDSLLGGWNIATRRVIDPGHAPQITDTHLGQLFSRHSVYNDAHGTLRYMLRFTPMTWINDLAVVPRPLPLTGTWTFSGDAFYYQPTFGNNAFVRNENYPSTFVGDGWINTYEYYTGPMGYGQPGQYFGDAKVGVIRSATFSIQGNSMNLLVGGGDFPSQCYVALVDAQTSEVLFSETGRNSNEMDRRYWRLTPHIGKSVYLEIADLSTAPFGHICVDDIIESGDVIMAGNGGTGRTKLIPDEVAVVAAEPVAGRYSTRLLPNVPNPFNPSTTIAYEIANDANVRVDVFDARGAHIRTLVEDRTRAGRHDTTWNGTDVRGAPVASGVYFYRLMVDGRAVETRKMALLK